MKKKILIGSIIVVAILVGVSLTSVVGYQSVESNLKASPLFNVRSGRAIDEEGNSVTCDYVGKGKATNLYLHKENDKSDIIDALTSVIKRMDDKSLWRFANLITYQLKQNNELQQYTIEDVFQSLKQLKENPYILHQIEQQEDPEMLSNACTYWMTCSCPDTSKLIECLPLYIAMAFLYSLILTFVTLIIVVDFVTSLFKCNTDNF